MRDNMDLHLAKQYLKDKKSLEDIPVRLWDEDLCLLAMRENGINLSCLFNESGKPKISFEEERMYTTAVRQNGLALAYVPKEARTTALCLYAVMNNVDALENVPSYIRRNAKDAGTFLRDIVNVGRNTLLNDIKKRPEIVFSEQGLSNALYLAARECGECIFDYESQLGAICREMSEHLPDSDGNWYVENPKTGKCLNLSDDPTAYLYLTRDLARLYVTYSYAAGIAAVALHFSPDNKITSDFVRACMTVACLADQSRHVENTGAAAMLARLEKLEAMPFDELAYRTRSIFNAGVAEEHQLEDVMIGFGLRRQEDDRFELSLRLRCLQDGKELLSVRTLPLFSFRADMPSDDIQRCVSEGMNCFVNNDTYYSCDEEISSGMSM